METFSMNVISKTLSAQSEMIAPGVMGINFMRPEKPINTMSDVYRLVQEEEQNKVRSPAMSGGATPFFRQTRLPPTVVPKPAAKAPAPAPTFTPAPSFAPAPAPAPVAAPAPASMPVLPSPPIDTPSQGPCTDCGRTIVGAFVSLSDRILHDDCFKCSTCGASLRNIGFHNISNKLYCETHAVLAARVAASNVLPAVESETPSAAPLVEPITAPVVEPTLVAPPTQAPLPKLPTSIAQPTPTPFGHQRLPQTPSSSGSLTFRSISPQPFKRISGDFHKVTAPTSPTPGSAPTLPLLYSSGPLPFESTPYMPPDQPKSSLFSSLSDVTHSTTEMCQTVQRSTHISHQFSSHTQQTMECKQFASGQTKKFVWPPPKSEFEIEGETPNLSSSPLQNISPLVTQSIPASEIQNDSSSTLLSNHQVQQQVHQEKVVQQDVVQESTGLSSFTMPPLPTTFPDISAGQAVDSAIKAEIKLETVRATPAAAAPVAYSASQAPSFCPSLPPVADSSPAASTPAQSGVPTGAGSRPAPKKGRGQLMSEQLPGRLAICGDCGEPIRGPFIIALNRTWCPDHFHCNNAHCKTALLDVGFVEEHGQLYCESCYESFLAPICNKCSVRIKGDCLNALDKQWHPGCFICAYCSKPFGNTSFYLEDGLPYCEKDWNELFTTKCVGCGFPIEAGDRWVEALNNNYHSQCFKCSSCQKNLEGQSFYAKGGKPFCKQHAR